MESRRGACRSAARAGHQCDTAKPLLSGGRLLVAVIVALGSALVAGVVLALRRVGPESTFEPGLEFNPDFDLTEAEILADIRGESPHA
jgi:hypothetical protein